VSQLRLHFPSQFPGLGSVSSDEGT